MSRYGVEGNLVPSRYFLTGDFNDWDPAGAAFRFQEAVSDYGREGMKLYTGSHTLTTALPGGRIRFKITAAGWNEQWSVFPWRDDQPYDVEDWRFGPAAGGLRPFLIANRGAGQPPHMEWNAEPGEYRFDFHPASGTLAVHREVERLPGPVFFFWQTMDCGRGVHYDVHAVLPYGYGQAGGPGAGLCLFFDGRSLVYGEDEAFQVVNQSGRQWWRSIDILQRHGAIRPVIILAVGVPYVTDKRGRRYHRRSSAYMGREPAFIQELHVRSLLDDLLPLAEETFRCRTGREPPFLVGHSNGGDFAMRLLAGHPERFSGAAAVSPGAVRPWLMDAAKHYAPGDLASVRLGIGYARYDLAPGFVVGPPSIGPGLRKLEIPHLIHYFSGATHDPATIGDDFQALASFLLG